MPPAQIDYDALFAPGAAPAAGGNEYDALFAPGAAGPAPAQLSAPARAGGDPVLAVQGAAEAVGRVIAPVVAPVARAAKSYVESVDAAPMNALTVAPKAGVAAGRVAFKGLELLDQATTAVFKPAAEYLATQTDLPTWVIAAAASLGKGGLDVAIPMTPTQAKEFAGLMKGAAQKVGAVAPAAKIIEPFQSVARAGESTPSRAAMQVGRETDITAAKVERPLPVSEGKPVAGGDLTPAQEFIPSGSPAPIAADRRFGGSEIAPERPTKPTPPTARTLTTEELVNQREIAYRQAQLQAAQERAATAAKAREAIQPPSAPAQIGTDISAVGPEGEGQFIARGAPKAGVAAAEPPPAAVAEVKPPVAEVAPPPRAESVQVPSRVAEPAPAPKPPVEAPKAPVPVPAASSRWEPVKHDLFDGPRWGLKDADGRYMTGNNGQPIWFKSSAQAEKYAEPSQGIPPARKPDVEPRAKVEPPKAPDAPAPAAAVKAEKGVAAVKEDTRVSASTGEDFTYREEYRVVDLKDPKALERAMKGFRSSPRVSGSRYMVERRSTRSDRAAEAAPWEAMDLAKTQDDAFRQIDDAAEPVSGSGYATYRKKLTDKKLADQKAYEASPEGRRDAQEKAAAADRARLERREEELGQTRNFGADPAKRYVLKEGPDGAWTGVDTVDGDTVASFPAGPESKVRAERIIEKLNKHNELEANYRPGPGKGPRNESEAYRNQAPKKDLKALEEAVAPLDKEDRVFDMNDLILRGVIEPDDFGATLAQKLAAEAKGRLNKDIEEFGSLGAAGEPGALGEVKAPAKSLGSAAADDYLPEGGPEAGANVGELREFVEKQQRAGRDARKVADAYMDRAGLTKAEEIGRKVHGPAGLPIQDIEAIGKGKLAWSWDAVKEGSGGVSKSIKDGLLDLVANPGKIGRATLQDWVRPANAVLKRLGLGVIHEAWLGNKVAFEQGMKELADRVIPLYKSAGVRRGSDMSRAIFRHLDGRASAEGSKIMGEAGLKVANEMKVVLRDIADKIWKSTGELPPEARITDYITHLLKNGREDIVNPEIFSAFKPTIKGVDDQFLKSRVGSGQEIIEDVVEAFDAYARVSMRHLHFDRPAKDMAMLLQSLKLPKETHGLTVKYIESYFKKQVSAPEAFEELMGAGVKNLAASVSRVASKVPGGKRFAESMKVLSEMPTVAAYRRGVEGARQRLYLGALGGAFDSVLTNSTQVVNTFAELGGRWTSRGYRDWAAVLAGNKELAEKLAKSGTLSDHAWKLSVDSVAIEMRNAVGEAIMKPFGAVEGMNRSVAFFGGYRRALARGLSEDAAIKAGEEIAAKTQFRYITTDTPLALQTAPGKIIGQLGSYPLRQAEFVRGMHARELIRYVVGGLAVSGTLGAAFPSVRSSVLPLVWDDKNGLRAGWAKVGVGPIVNTAIHVSEAMAGKRGAGMNLLRDASLLVPGGRALYGGFRSQSKGEGFMRGFLGVSEGKEDRVEKVLRPAPPRFY